MTTNFEDSTNRCERALFVPSYDSLLSVRLLPQYLIPQGGRVLARFIYQLLEGGSEWRLQ